MSSAFQEVRLGEPSNLFIAGAVNIGVGELQFAGENEKTQEIQVTLLTFVKWGTTEEEFQVAIPMGHPLGDLFFTGELTMQLREMWEEWWKENPNGAQPT